MLQRIGVYLGRNVAPVRFLVFGAVFLAVSALAGLQVDQLRVALLVGFDAAALVFFASAFPLLDHAPAEMRQAAQANDANRIALLAITALISLVVLVSVGTLVADKSSLHGPGVALVVATLVLSWGFANTIFALHYAHLYYLPLEEGGGDQGGLDIPGSESPGYWDFLYFSFTLGMTFQTSDVSISRPHLRKVVLGHSMLAFIFNIGVLAFTVNALGGM